MKDGRIICMGEILWDSLPAGLFLGGAPFNVAHDLHRMGTRARIISRVGSDVLGREIMRRLQGEGMSTDLIQIDRRLPTGFVDVSIDSTGNPSYLIKEPVAWDSIELDKKSVRVVAEAEVLVFGTLASRNKRSRETIQRLLESDAVKVLDVNLRAGAESREIVEALLKSADIVKVNASEFDALRNWFKLPANDRDAAEDLAVKFSCKMVCISDGARGGSLWHEGRWVRHPGFRVDPRNSVGAGDAFLAGLLTSFVKDKSDEEMIETANLLGAYVVTKTEATPQFDAEDIEAIRTGVSPRAE